jgi:hypothetical protein
LEGCCFSLLISKSLRQIGGEMPITFEEGERGHNALWGWAAETGGRKEDWPEWEYNGGEQPEIMSDCFCCEYVQCFGDNLCESCPIKWTDPEHALEIIEDDLCPCQEAYDSPFRAWEAAEDIEQRKRLAAIIRDMPWTRRDI